MKHNQVRKTVTKTTRNSQYVIVRNLSKFTLCSLHCDVPQSCDATSPYMYSAMAGIRDYRVSRGAVEWTSRSLQQNWRCSRCSRVSDSAAVTTASDVDCNDVSVSQSLRSIAMSMHVCVCLSVSEDISGTTHVIFTKFLCALPMSMARSSSGMLIIGRIAYRWEGGDGGAQPCCRCRLHWHCLTDRLNTFYLGQLCLHVRNQTYNATHSTSGSPTPTLSLKWT